MTKKPKTFFTADHHFGHRRILELCARPFADVSEMRELIISRWNERVGENDVIYHLGDFAYRASNQEIAETFARLNGVKHLVVGNHDQAATLSLPWASTSKLAEISVDGQNIVLCHYPLLEWRGYHRGAIHAFGHVHGRTPGVGRSCDVGVDCWDYRPVSLDEIISSIDDRPADRLEQLLAAMPEDVRDRAIWMIEQSEQRRLDRERIQREAAEDRAKDAKERGE